MSEDNITRVMGVIILTFMLWLLFAIPYAFVYVLPRPLQLWAGLSFVFSTIMFIADWVVARRGG